MVKLKRANLSLSKAQKELDTTIVHWKTKNGSYHKKNDEIRDLERRIEEKKEELRREPSEITTARLQGRGLRR